MAKLPKHGTMAVGGINSLYYDWLDSYSYVGLGGGRCIAVLDSGPTSKFYTYKSFKFFKDKFQLY